MQNLNLNSNGSPNRLSGRANNESATGGGGGFSVISQASQP